MISWNACKLLSLQSVLTLIFSSWLYIVSKVCRLSGYPKSDWSTLASTLLENTPQTLFDTADTKARKTSPQALWKGSLTGTALPSGVN